MADVTEQSARLNTLMRFQQYEEALPFAYKYRLDLQLSFPKSSNTDKALRNVEEVIDRLERFEHRWKRWGKMAWGLLIGERYIPPDDPTDDTEPRSSHSSDSEREY